MDRYTVPHLLLRRPRGRRVFEKLRQHSHNVVREEQKDGRGAEPEFKRDRRNFQLSKKRYLEESEGWCSGKPDIGIDIEIDR